MSRSVLIADDNEVVRKAIRLFFQTLTDWNIRGEAGDGMEAIEKARTLNPDLILLDFSMPHLNGLQAAAVLRKMLPETKIIVFTMFDDALGSRISSAVGVDLVVPKAKGLPFLLESIQRLMGTSGLINGTPHTGRQEPSGTDQS
jgi:DNA-binding NarL/FixJ family response regulator